MSSSVCISSEKPQLASVTLAGQGESNAILSTKTVCPILLSRTPDHEWLWHGRVLQSPG